MTFSVEKYISIAKRYISFDVRKILVYNGGNKVELIIPHKLLKPQTTNLILITFFAPNLILIT